MKIKKIQIILRKNMKNLYFLLKDVISQFLHKNKKFIYKLSQKYFCKKNKLKIEFQIC